MSALGRISGPQSGARLNRKQYSAWYAKVRSYDRVKQGFLDLIDAHYGTSYHHIGDGDGIEKHRADELRELIKELKDK